MQPLLTLCARLEGDAATYAQLTHLAQQPTLWADLPALAEAQGLAPLLYHHLQAAGVTLPLPVKRDLQGLTLRHRHANEVRRRVLVEILAAFQTAGIETRVLKGAALAFLVYPEPGLRPMRDMDLLVKKADVLRAQQLLADLGFSAPLPAPGQWPDKHLATATRLCEGLTVSVELHYNLFNAFDPASLTLEELSGPPSAFILEGVTAFSLGYEAMLWHLCEHVAYHASIWEPIRLIWVADVVGLAERFAAQIDWPQVARRYPLVLNTLSLFHFVTPLSANLRRLAPLKIGSRPPQGVGQEFEGFPRMPLKALRGQSYRQALSQTFFPSEWWLRLHYRLDSAQPLFWYRWVRHPLYILGPFYLAEKVRLWWHLKLRRRDFTLAFPPVLW